MTVLPFLPIMKQLQITGSLVTYQCGKRVYDIWETRFGVVAIELKCQHCGEAVRIQCTQI